MVAPWEIDRRRGGSKNNDPVTDAQYDKIGERTNKYYIKDKGFMSGGRLDRFLHGGTMDDSPASQQPRNNNRYGGGYGGGYVDPNKTFNPYAQAVLSQLQKQQGAPGWASKIDQFVNNDIDAAKAAWGNVPAAEANPYSDMDVAYAEQLAPDMAALLASQGIDPAVYGAQVAGANAGLNAAGSNWENLRRSNAANVDASNAAFNNDVGVMRANSVSNLEAQRAALQMAAAQQEESRKQKTIEAIIALLAQGYGAGADVSKIDLGEWA